MRKARDTVWPEKLCLTMWETSKMDVIAAYLLSSGDRVHGRGRQQGSIRSWTLTRLIPSLISQSTSILSRRIHCFLTSRG